MPVGGIHEIKTGLDQTQIFTLFIHTIKIEELSSLLKVNERTKVSPLEVHLSVLIFYMFPLKLIVHII